MIRRFLFTPPPKNLREVTYQNLGLLNAFIKRCCEVCSSIFSPVIRNDRIQASNDVVYLYRRDGASYVSVSIGFDKPRKDLGLLLDGKPTQSYGYAYRVDSKWVDVEGIRSRLSKCLKFHGTVCPVSKSSNPSLQTRPAWLIDIKRMCITPSTISMRYIALSYVWVGQGHCDYSNATLVTFKKETPCAIRFTHPVFRGLLRTPSNFFVFSKSDTCG